MCNVRAENSEADPDKPEGQRRASLHPGKERSALTAMRRLLAGYRRTGFRACSGSALMSRGKGCGRRCRRANRPALLKHEALQVLELPFSLTGFDRQL